ncbi:hypothetical protein ACA910_001776 [Epithemia clementina (nom. ined.)]
MSASPSKSASKYFFNRSFADSKLLAKVGFQQNHLRKMFESHGRRQLAALDRLCKKNLFHAQIRQSKW